MGNCCGYQFPEQYENIFGASEDGAKVINGMIAELWPDIAHNMLEQLKTTPYDLGRYRLTVKDFHREETLDDVPVIKRIKIDPDSNRQDGEAGGPVKFTAKVVYKLDKPQMDILLSNDKEENGLFSFFMPEINVELKNLLIDATLHAELSMKDQTLKFYFVGNPLVHWDIEIEVSKLEVPLVGEDLLDSALARRLGKIDKKNPMTIDFSSVCSNCKS
mmetsp:Transcript_5733/g.7243  ORF Transcript_5733/g.7243 Transcript_5733/m.7243 type:complete len:217 (-) Transcript_5733:365-1015(-)|eukprot:CAMPEP_0204832616 /NCGR_PEP_ID=MMETSP1346-20131115/14291_1 /ASSEMBLY_ACC=CAM_ASM_000771 /TAXON_ID=215587 /ORGANISM="Aplanochytrium stocchinoi, Strain GSBS06" /LENGTH=216 /DNA_ID=CAMNT_0051964559 /DNA_START=192 /DNA_END=842 /DNA_ORIENTATION=-